MQIRQGLRLFLFLVALPVFSQNSQPINGIVMGAGRPIEGAVVIVRDFQQSYQGYVSSKWEDRTAADGRFTFGTGRGCYDVLVSANNQFLPWSRRVCLKANGPAVMKITLKADPHPVLLQE